MTPHQYLTQALARWPEFGVEHTFVAQLNTGLLDGLGPGEFQPEDLYLACAAVKGVPGAVREVEELLRGLFRAMGHLRLPPSAAEEIRASLLATLLTGTAESPPRLSRYAGRGPLGGWLRVVATRAAIDWIRKQGREPAVDDEALLGNLESPAEAPELAHLKERYRGEFSAAFRRAIQSLEVRQRNLLRQHYLDELSLEELAAFYRVHRATAARWLASARQALLEKTRDEVSRALGLARAEVDSLMRLVQSRLDLSAGIFLSAARPAAKPDGV